MINVEVTPQPRFRVRKKSNHNARKVVDQIGSNVRNRAHIAHSDHTVVGHGIEGN